MKIIFLINSPFPYYSGGIETWLYNISKRICHENEVIILSANYKPYGLMFDNISPKIRLYKYQTLTRFKVLRPFMRSYIALISWFFDSHFMCRELKKLIEVKEKCYLIALDTMFTVYAGVLAKKYRPNLKIIASSRGPHAEITSNSVPFSKPLLLKFEKQMLKKANTIWANGFDTLKNLNDKGFSASLMRNGVDFENINKNITQNNIRNHSLDMHNIKIAAIGTLLPIKGIFELISAISILDLCERKNIEVYFIGKGDPKKYKKYAKTLNIENKVHFIGHSNDVVRYMKESDIIACLSGGSGMSMVALEAMASSVPIIAWDNNVYRQFNLEQKTMYLVEEKNAKKLADGIIEIINDYKKYKLMAEAAYKEAEKFDWSKISDEFLTNLKKVF